MRARTAFLLVACLAAARAGEDPPDEARKLFDRAVEDQRDQHWRSAQKAFRKLLEEHPTSRLVPLARARGGDNCYLGTTPVHVSGPSTRRIDVAVMGDGFTIDVSDQKMQERWAGDCLTVLMNEKAFGEYQDYFNFWFVRLGSLEEGVDPGLSPEELKKAQERNRSRRRDINYKVDYSTALDCKAAGPQGQVMADSGLVYKWLEIAQDDVPGCGDDGFVIAFARFGVLGMGGGGIANVGRPDKSVTTHEFGHAFSRLLDEYAVNPGPPEGMWARTLQAPNAWPSREEPKDDEVPWAHMLKKRVKGVGVYEGGATYKKGVWKPARTCAMNIGGNQFCPVCREQTILVIYEFVSPIDEALPDPAAPVEAVCEGEDVLTVVPMAPRRHRLEVDWFVAPARVTTPADGAAPASPAAPAEPPPGDGLGQNLPRPPPADAGGEGAFDGLDDSLLRRGMGGRAAGAWGAGPRAAKNRDAYADPPEGEPSRLGKRIKGRGKDPDRHVFPLGKLPAGRYVITAEVRDPTDWVVKDEKHLLKERVTWTVSIAPPE